MFLVWSLHAEDYFSKDTHTAKILDSKDAIIVCLYVHA